MKKIAVFFNSPEKMSYPFNKKEYWIAYQELDQEIKKLGAEFYVVRAQETYLGNSKFSKSWQFENNELIETGAIQADVLYQKGDFITDGKITLSNSLELDDICTDKWKTYQLLEKFCPLTLIAQNDREFAKAIDQIKTEKIVIKPQDQEEGRGVYIGNRKYIESVPKEYPILIQEFIDSSMGIPGIVEGIHDFRVAVMNSKILYTFVRTPPQGKLMANIALGGTVKIIEEQELPKEIKKFIIDVDKKLSQFGDRFYGIDFAYTPQGIRIIELNSRLGLPYMDTTLFSNFKKKLTQYLMSLKK
ncbi:MAG: ATP-grasp domain-containing protein [Candidatus Pacebacteria bacterium]|nr:ATP-grasp domain-containing protein [Candidatus Paceibacterota bacterium]MBT4652282.1 ATP-grasp domain-containing protein [Candidatus Paceibacterota bacterium]MBT6756475.1 ATP-grasp domain-containing protein [Candidatus Paceibacterota bacterium]MBT6920912.1 ATP-grasp domain-containing protein [Candidatus Paceibacterota bacterium]